MRHIGTLSRASRGVNQGPRRLALSHSSKKHFNKPLVMTEVDEQRFKNMDGCHICGEKYTDKDVRVRDHSHITGKFRGSAHQECNLKLRIKPETLKIPVIFHNLRGYDSHIWNRLVK